MSAPETSDSKRVLYLQEIDINLTEKIKINITLRNDTQPTPIALQKEKGAAIWRPTPSVELRDTSKLVLTVAGERKRDLISFNKPEARMEVVGQELMEKFWDGKESLKVETTFRNQPLTATFVFRPSTASEMTRSAVQNLQEAMKNYRPLMSDATQQRIDRGIGIGEVFGELNPIVKMAFTAAKKTSELLKEQQKHDTIAADLAKRIEEILPFANTAVGDSVGGCDVELLVNAADKLYKLVEETAWFIHDYVKRSAGYRAAKSIGFPEDQIKIKEFTEKFTKMKEDFDRALNVETLKKVERIENKIIVDRLKPITHATYDEARKCMEGTRTGVLDDIMNWTLKTPPPDDPSKVESILWLHGTPGLGKTAIANSLCADLHNIGRLGGSFFCRRDDPVLSEPKYLLPALIYQLAGTWAPYRKLVAKALEDDSHLGTGTPTQLLPKLLLGPLGSIRDYPTFPLIVVIDALDECGDPSMRRILLSSLSKMTTCAQWLKIVITSRPEQDIQSFFSTMESPTIHTTRDLVESDAKDDIYFFTKSRLALVATSRGLQPDWPGESKIAEISALSDGLFLFVETIYRLLIKTINPSHRLATILGEESDKASKSLNELYQRTIELVIDKEEMGLFRKIAGGIIAVASHRALCEDTLAALLGLDAGIVKALVNELGSLFYRDKAERGGIRVRHLSILEFLTKLATQSDFRVDLNATNTVLGTSCLKIMMKELKFNICQLETSSQFNSQIKDLEMRINQHIPDTLQYSCVHWSSHVCSSGGPSNGIGDLLEKVLHGEKALHWLEVLSLLGKVHAALSSLQQLKVWLKGTQGLCQELAEDISRFLMAFMAPISTSAPHIYLSALPFSPKKSLLWNNSKDSFQNLLDVYRGRLECWQLFPHVWKGHSGAVAAVTYSPDGCQIVSGSWDETIRIWDAKTGQQVGEPLTGHTGSVTSVSYSPDGCQIVSGSFDQTIHIWDAKTGQQVGEPLTGHTRPVNSVSYSPDGCKIISGSWDGTICIWNAKTGQQVGEPLTGHTGSVNSVSYSPDGCQIISGSGDCTICIWDAKTGQQVIEPLTGHTRSVNSVSYSPDGSQIVSCSSDHTICFWDAKTGQQVGEPLTGHTSSVNSVSYSPNGHQIVSGSSDQTICIWDVKTRKKVVEPFTGHTSSINTVSYSLDGCQIVSGSWDETIQIWDAKTGQEVGERLTGHTGSVNDVSYSPNGCQIASGSSDHTICIWDSKTGQQIGEPLTGHTNWVNSVSYSPDGCQIVSGSSDQTICIWDAKTGQQLGKPLTGHAGSVNSVSYSPDGCQIVSGSGDQTICIWDAKTGQQVVEPLTGHTNLVNTVSYSPDGSQIVSGSGDYTVRIWDAKTGQQVGKPLTGHTNSVNSVSYSPNGCQLVSGSSDKTIRIWDVNTGQQICEPLTGHTQSVNSVSYSPNGFQIVSGSWDETICIWDAKTGQQAGEPLIGHTNLVNSVFYSPDGSQIVSGSGDHTVRIWDAKARQQVAEPLTGHNSSVDSVSYSLDASQIVSDSPNQTIHIWDPQNSLPNFFNLDHNGWINHQDKLIFWVPEDCCNGLQCPALITIPVSGQYQIVRVDMNQMKYGALWTGIQRACEC